MAIRNEIKVGILGICSIVGLFWGFNFLKGKNVFSENLVLRAVFDNVEGLQIAAPVTINGLRVGAVTQITLGAEQYDGKIIAELSIQGDVSMPKNEDTYALLVQPSIMSGKTIELKFKGNCTSGCYASGDVIMGRAAGMLDGIKPIIDPYLSKMDSVSQMWATIATNESGAFRKSMDDIAGTIGNLKAISDQVNNLLVSSSANIAVTMSNLKAITDNVKANNDEISAMLANLNDITKQVKDGNVENLLKQTSNTVETLNKTIAELQTTLKKTNQTVDQLQQLTNIKDQNGLVSKLLYDKAFASDMQTTILDAQYLMRDIRLHPERYRTVLSGKKKKYKHTDTESDPAHQNK